MTFNLHTIDWNALSAIATSLGVLIALFYQPFINRRKILIESGLRTNVQKYEHELSIKIINLGANPIYITACGFGLKIDGKSGVKLIEDERLPKKLEPSEMIEFNNLKLSKYLKYISTFYAQDSYGKFWNIKPKYKKELFKNIGICMQNIKQNNNEDIILIKRPKIGNR